MCLNSTTNKLLAHLSLLECMLLETIAQLLSKTTEYMDTHTAPAMKSWTKTFFVYTTTMLTGYQHGMTGTISSISHRLLQERSVQSLQSQSRTGISSDPMWLLNTTRPCEESALTTMDQYRRRDSGGRETTSLEERPSQCETSGPHGTLRKVLTLSDGGPTSLSQEKAPLS